MEDITMEDDWIDVNSSQSVTARIDADDESKIWSFETVSRSANQNGPQKMQDWKLNPIPQKDLDCLYQSIKTTAGNLVATRQPIFRTEIEDIKIDEQFVDHLPCAHQQEMRCTCCRKFLRRFGHLAIVDTRTGDLIPLFWNGADFVDNIFRGSVSNISKLLATKKAKELFKVSSSLKSLGKETLGGYSHMHFEFPEERVVRNSIPGFGPAAASDLASMLDRVLRDYDNKTVDHVEFLIIQDKLPYASTHKAAIKWLRDLLGGKKIELAKNETQRHNLLYHYASGAFVGCISQLRSGALSTLLDDVQAGRNFSQIQRSWEAVANPHMYMRPQATPSLGQVSAAEKLFEKLGLTARDMRRKYLTPTEVPDHAYIYRRSNCKEAAPARRQIFGNLACKDDVQDNGVSDVPPTAISFAELLPPTAISFAKLVNEILPEAKRVEYRLPAVGILYFFITGLPGTAPLMQFHDAENLASWYTYPLGTVFPANGLREGWTQVDGIIAFPHLWSDLKNAGKDRSIPTSKAEIDSYKHKRHGIRYLIQFPEAIENRQASLCLFPTLLKAEFHGVRQTIEAYSNKKMTEYPMDPSESFVGGVEIAESYLSRRDGRREPHVFRVTDAKGQVDTFEIVIFS